MLIGESSLLAFLTACIVSMRNKAFNPHTMTILIWQLWYMVSIKSNYNFDMKAI